jgi:hypothetical protein
MPEPLQEADTGQMMQERIDGLESYTDELDSVDLEDWDPDGVDEHTDEAEALGEWIIEKGTELTSIEPDVY